MFDLRPERLISARLILPAMRVRDGRRGRRLPILMYHAIRPELSAKRPYFETNTAPVAFESHMRFLSESGFHAVTLREGLQRLRGGPDDKPVVITFDDGYRDFYAAAMPVLAKYGQTATVFVMPGLTGDRPGTFAGRELMTWSEIRQIHAAGIEVGSHSLSHPELPRLNNAQLRDELWRSKSEIESQLGEQVDSFSHPYAFPEQSKAYVATLCSLLAEGGYRQGVSTIIGTAAPGDARFHLPRLPVNSHDDRKFFEAKLAGAYDWLRAAQTIYKRWIKANPPGPGEPASVEKEASR